MALDVKVKIELSKTTGKIGFGVPLLLECNADEPVAYVECSSLDAVVSAGFAVGTEMYKAANMVFLQKNRPDKVAICAVEGTAVSALPALVTRGWRQLVLVGAGTSDYTAVADYIETTKDKMLFVSMPYETFATFKTGLEGKKYDRFCIFVNGTEYAAAALVGETAGRAAGSFTYKFKTLAGVVAEDLTDAQIEEIHKAGAFAYVTKAGDDITTEGISQSGMYLDITDSIDYVVQNIEYRVQKVFNNSAKVPYDDRGIALLEAATITALQDAYLNGIIAVLEDGVTPDYSTKFTARAGTTEADRASRIYPYGSFDFALAGAIHECHVYGEVSY